ncbi:MAG: GNAT family N-acetyltransferase [Methanomassiliicoccales archaeon]
MVRNFDPTRDLTEVYSLCLQTLQEGYSAQFLIDVHKLWEDGFLVLEDRGVIQGFLGGLFVSMMHARIFMLGVRPRGRRRGYATMLCREFLKRCVLIGIRLVTLEVRESNFAAIEFYKKLGFQVAMRVDNYYTDGEAAYKMQIML